MHIYLIWKRELKPSELPKILANVNGVRLDFRGEFPFSKSDRYIIYREII